jgi:hypothetical protein
MSDKIRNRIMHEARNIWGGEIKRDLLKNGVDENHMIYSQEKVHRLVMNRILYHLTVRKLKKCADYWMELSYQGQVELMREALPDGEYRI